MFWKTLEQYSWLLETIKNGSWIIQNMSWRGVKIAYKRKLCKEEHWEEDAASDSFLTWIGLTVEYEIWLTWNMEKDIKRNVVQYEVKFWHKKCQDNTISLY